MIDILISISTTWSKATVQALLQGVKGQTRNHMLRVPLSAQFLSPKLANLQNALRVSNWHGCDGLVSVAFSMAEETGRLHVAHKQHKTMGGVIALLSGPLKTLEVVNS